MFANRTRLQVRSYVFSSCFLLSCIVWLRASQPALTSDRGGGSKRIPHLLLFRRPRALTSHVTATSHHVSTFVDKNVACHTFNSREPRGTSVTGFLCAPAPTRRIPRQGQSGCFFAIALALLRHPRFQHHVTQVQLHRAPHFIIL